MSRIRLLTSKKVIPVFVFDGGKLQMKSNIDNDRLYLREENRRIAENLLR
jgi:exonuclease-1